MKRTLLTLSCLLLFTQIALAQVGMPLEYEDRVTVRKSSTTFNLIQAHTRNYFDVLRNKLKWGS